MILNEVTRKLLEAVLDSRILPQVMPSGTDVRECTETGVYFFDGVATNYVNMPSATCHNAMLIVKKVKPTNAGLRITHMLISVNENAIYTETSTGNNQWNGWSTRFATIYDLTTALANYLPLDGTQSMTGNLTISVSSALSRQFTIGNSIRKIMLQVLDDGGARLYDYKNAKNVIHLPLDGSEYTFNGIASGNLPLTGGIIDSTLTTPLEINSKNDQTLSLMRFKKNGVSQGHIGFNGVDNPVFINGAGDMGRSLLHKGNSNAILFTESAAAAPSDTTALWAHL